LDDFALAVGEAGVNAIKHVGAGRVRAGAGGGRVWAAVSDQGPGIDEMMLTQAVFRRGFSTKPSLGLGFTFILNGADHVLLCT
jgi:anti-sigma regulatory factor (Ser/Thr protein kinase)